MSASEGRDEGPAEARQIFVEIRELAQRATASSVPLVQRDAALVIALADQALELLEWSDLSD